MLKTSHFFVRFFYLIQIVFVIFEVERIIFFTDEIIDDNLGKEFLQYWPENISDPEWDEMNIDVPVFRLESVNAWQQLTKSQRVFWDAHWI